MREKNVRHGRILTLGDGKDIAPNTIESINQLLKDVSPDLRLKS